MLKTLVTVITLALMCSVTLSTFPAAAQKSVAASHADAGQTAHRASLAKSRRLPRADEETTFIIQRTTDIVEQPGSAPKRRQSTQTFKRLRTSDNEKIAALKLRGQNAAGAAADAPEMIFPLELLSAPARPATSVCANAEPYRVRRGDETTPALSYEESGVGDAPTSQKSIFHNGKLIATASYQYERRKDSWDLVSQEFLTLDGRARDFVSIKRLDKEGKPKGGVLPRVACEQGGSAKRGPKMQPGGMFKAALYEPSTGGTRGGPNATGLNVLASFSYQDSCDRQQTADLNACDSAYTAAAATCLLDWLDGQDRLKAMEAQVDAARQALINALEKEFWYCLIPINPDCPAAIADKRIAAENLQAQQRAYDAAKASVESTYNSCKNSALTAQYSCWLAAGDRWQKCKDALKKPLDEEGDDGEGDGGGTGGGTGGGDGGGGDEGETYCVYEITYEVYTGIILDERLLYCYTV